MLVLHKPLAMLPPVYMQFLQDCFPAIQSWMTYNKLQLKPDKTKFLLIGAAAPKHDELADPPPPPCTPPLPLPLFFDIIQRQMLKALDFKFTFSDHVFAIAKRISSKVEPLAAIVVS